MASYQPSRLSTDIKRQLLLLMKNEAKKYDQNNLPVEKEIQSQLL
jgi:hypothetical protein